MRNFVLALAAVGSAVAVASPASAQYYPQSHGYGYGYNNGTWGDPGDFQRRLFNIRRSLGSVRPDQAYRLDAEARTLERQLRTAARNGLNPSETQYFNSRVYQLEVRLGRSVANRGYGYNGYSGYNGYYSDGGRRDRDNRRDRDDD